MLSASLKKNYKGLLLLLMAGGGGGKKWNDQFYFTLDFIQTLLFLTRLPTRQDGIESRDKVYWFERMRSLFLREVFMDVSVVGSGKASTFTSQ